MPLRRLNDLIVRISASGWLFVATLAVMVGTLQALLYIGEIFPARSGGVLPFDLQHELRREAVVPQLAGYTAATRQLYFVFTAIDFVFPLAAGLVLAATAAFCLRRVFPLGYAALVGRSLLPLFLAGTVFDWGENVAALVAILSYPETPAGIPTALVLAKRLKLVSSGAAQMLMFLLLVSVGVQWLRRRVGR